jgi:subtilisin family serine protease
VGAVLAAGDGDHGPLGVNPSAKLVACAAFKEDFKDEPTKNADHITDLVMQYGPSVINMSFRYDRPDEGEDGGGQDPIETLIRSLPNTLFVAAAGNENQREDGTCDIRPACFAFPNMLSVVALDLGMDDPELLKKAGKASNYGANLHVGAPGLGVMSALQGNKFGCASGTSQATPLVAGAASLLFAREPCLQPVDVKQRLIYTGDLFDGLQDKVFGGRLNIARALDYATDVVDLDGGRTLRGSLVRPENATVYYDPVVRPRKPRDAFELYRVLRLQRSAASNLYTAYLEPSDARTDGVPERLVGIKVLRQSQAPLKFQPEGGGEAVEFDVTEIRDLVSRLHPDETLPTGGHVCAAPPPV